MLQAERSSYTHISILGFTRVNQVFLKKLGISQVDLWLVKYHKFHFAPQRKKLGFFVLFQPFLFLFLVSYYKCTFTLILLGDQTWENLFWSSSLLTFSSNNKLIKCCIQIDSFSSRVERFIHVFTQKNSSSSNLKGKSG